MPALRGHIWCKTALRGSLVLCKTALRGSQNTLIKRKVSYFCFCQLMKGKIMNIEKVKTHLKENGKVYIGVASGITVGVAATIFIHNNGVYNILNSFNFNWKSTNIGFIILTVEDILVGRKVS